MSPSPAPRSNRPDQAARLPAGRKADLALYVSEAGQVTVGALAEHFGVSADTIRRDLDQLDADGVLVRTHGGAVSQSVMETTEKKLDLRLRLQTSAKDKIGALAAGLVQDGSVIMINAGTTTLAAVRHLDKHRNLTVATNNLRIPIEMPPDVCRDLYVFGGAVRLSGQSTIGPVGFQFAGSGNDLDVRCDLALISVGAVSADGGYSTSNLAEAVMMSEMVARASRVAILADSTKFGRQLFAQVAELGRADYFITDQAPPPDLAKAFRKSNVEVLTPPPGSPDKPDLRQAP
ncbi:MULTISPECIES: DeoR/GlpR family DNA-binding transcription regulator [unclassified Cryobacterium]|uniref:DeoR/GlpR family DNA-binding transcription regulator n=1 Tax=unclassified Cryobacterium TaxID=2649013 RepID=UPI00106DA847|nr:MULTISPECIES: DeoR/GlpR family DNA-binding transcription regulator [unclassified Cryobacterium]MDY7529737.1 DeoR/GlpR family DNA-binding transcription regulator [Cryobacterium sp. 10C2]MDY7558134.1 DeoR/GlpR family DNA-binding transcription regulator [Cryobacterium sp. 10C3]MEB0001844.1 DeoR/GlpR family DNA-binding transcription regulator [Cryobacterium sp. RTC2.1]MEB0202802.1 DeoR/GlpR family DNA-binding transcription regulator [Cryobacterium sp. 5I3]MEB0286020.1 DeoR/GlpR family DNA-bindi